MVDDSGLLCDAYNTTKLGDSDCTILSIMEKEKFPNWLAARQNNIESIMDFNE
jgi:hypothetical protein